MRGPFFALLLACVALVACAQGAISYKRCVVCCFFCSRSAGPPPALATAPPLASAPPQRPHWRAVDSKRASLLTSPRSLSGPPSEFAQHRTPSPLNAALREESALLPVRLTAGQVSFTQKLAVDSATMFEVMLYLPPAADALSLALFYPNGTAVGDLAPYKQNGQWPVSSTGQMVTAPGWRFVNPPRGMWTAVLTRTDRLPFARVAAPGAGHPDAYLFLFNDSPHRLFSHFGTYAWTQQSVVGVAAQLYDATANPTLVRGQRPVPSSARVISASLDMYLPDGRCVFVCAFFFFCSQPPSESVLAMSDDGQHFDMLASDNVWGGSFVSTEVGTYRITTLFQGQLDDGTPFMRSAEHAMVVVNSTLAIPPHSSARLDAAQAVGDSDQVTVSIPVSGVPSSPSLRAYAEVYGTDASTGALVAACWIGGYTTVDATTSTVSLEFNKRWLATAKVTEPLVLRTVTLYDGQVHVPLASAAELPVTAASLNLAKAPAAPRPTEEMRMGVRPAHLYPHVAAMRRANRTEALASLVLLHGYCAKNNPWTRNNPVVFTDYAAFVGGIGQSFLNDVYAQMVIAQYADLPSFALVGHSQGGLVAAHIRNYYWTPNDAVAPGKRAVQTMGSPFQGVSGAGAALDLGALFGLGCGNNFDLTLDGAALWNSGLTSSARADVYYYTTQYESGWFASCNAAVQLVLEKPNDGTTELNYSNLPGATHVSHSEGECHTENMSDPPQTENVARNKQINAAAAR